MHTVSSYERGGRVEGRATERGCEVDFSTGLGGSRRKQLLGTTSWSRAANTELRSSMASRACVPPCDCEAPLFTWPRGGPWCSQLLSHHVEATRGVRPKRTWPW
eukprot:4030151-Prymnesium_polylepis.3